MTLLGVEGLLEAGIQIKFFICSENTKLYEALLELQKSFPQLEIFTEAQPTKKFQGLRNHWEKSHINYLSDAFRQWQANGVLCAQGDLELSSRGLLAGKQAGLATVSYIPYAHQQADMGAKLGQIRDFFNRYLLNVPDAFITITENARAGLKRLGSRVPIDVVYNGINLERFTGNKQQARELFDLPDDKFILALCGRLESKQKGQGLLLKAISASTFLQQNVLTLIVGDGPDESLLKNEVEKQGLADAVRFVGWCDTALLYPALDALVIASRFEGMPLVMLEALASKVPVVSTRRDGMQEILPENWLFYAEDIEMLADTIQRVLNQNTDAEVERLNLLVRNEMSNESFKENFAKSVIKNCKLS